MASRKKVINEDMSMMDNKWTSDPSRREHKPTVMTLFDIVKAYDRLKDSNHKAPVVMPYPTQFLVQDLGALYVKSEEIANALKNAAKNPLIGDNEDAMEATKRALMQTVVIRKAIKKLARFLDTTSLEDDGGDDASGSPADTLDSQY